jgi:transketolase
MRNTFAEYFLEAAKKDSRIILLTGDLGFGVLDKIAQELPRQFINAGIAEQSMMSMAAGMASEGFKPFVYSIANFPTFRCLEQIRNDVCYMNNPVTIVAVGAGLGYGNLGYSHHAVEDIGIMRNLPNMNLYSPSDPSEVRACVEDILNSDSPAYLRLGKGGEQNIHDEPVSSVRYPNILVKGNRGFIVFTGSIGARVVEALKLLNSENLFPSVVSNPKLNTDSIRELLNLARSSFILSVEEHALPSGFGSLLLEENSEHGFDIPIQRLGLGKTDISKLGTQSYLLDMASLSASDIAASFKKLALAQES